MADKVPLFGESEYYWMLFDEFNVIIHYLQVVSSILVPGSISKNCEVNGFPINFQFLYATALALKYLDDYADEDSVISGALDRIFRTERDAKILVLLNMLFTLVITVCYAKNYKFNAWWNTGGIVASLILALDHFTLGLTARDRWMIGSYMDIIAWMTLFEVSPKSKNYIIESYIILMFLDVPSILLHRGYGTYRDQFYGFAGYKLTLLKVLLIFCFIYQRIGDHINITSEVTEASVMTEVSSGSPKTPARQSVYCINDEKNISNKSESMPPN